MNDIPDAARSILDFWFGAQDTARPEWFRKDAAFDAEVARRYADQVERALSGELRHWEERTPSALARVLLLDQFTRNIFRGTPRAFAGDTLALSAARQMVTLGQDRELSPIRRTFAYLPFEHAEDRLAQDESVRLYTALAAEAPGLEETLDYAVRHRDIVARFGRFPHRNAILGRASTPEEAAFLLQPGSSF